VSDLMDRRQLLAGAAAGAGAIALPARADAWWLRADRSPRFSWLTVPCAADVGDSSRRWNSREASFLADHFSLVSIEKAHGLGAQPAGMKWTEPGFLADAAQLKRARPSTKVLFYWNAHDYYALYEVKANPAWLRQVGDPSSPGGVKHIYDQTKEDFRRWWVAESVRMASDPNVDGVFVDTIATSRGFNPPGTAELLLGELRAALDTIRGRRRLILYNVGGYTPFDGTGAMDPLLRIADGALIESFDRPEPNADHSPALRKKLLLDMAAAARAGKTVVLKAWPRFSFLTADGLSYAEKVRRARADITFPLAAFLAAAQRHTYLQYSWGYNMADPIVNPSTGEVPPDGGVIVETDQNSGVVDPRWYPELRRFLGPPLQDARVDGYVLSRRFLGAEVQVDLAARTATIDWLLS
jgi:Hypothetical glycosyl hydrolase family 15